MKLKIKKDRFFLGLTLFRIVLAVLLGILILNGRTKIATIFFLITALVAFFESLIYGKVIRKSLFRSLLDFVADRLLVDIVAISLTARSLLPLWVTLVFLSRDLLISIIASTLFYRDSRRDFKPTALGKVALFFQITAILPVMIGSLDIVLIWIAVVMTFASAIESLFKSEFKLRKRKRAIDEFKIFSLLKFADVFTLTNVIFGIISILFAIKGWFDTAGLMLIFAVVADYFDGKVAKLMNQQNDFGKELDSLADTVSFGVAPAIIGFTLIQTPLAVISFTIFLFCGILRLARYSIMESTKGFQGMPITMNGVLIPLALFLNFPVKFFPYLYLVLGILMVSSLQIKRIP